MGFAMMERAFELRNAMPDGSTKPGNSNSTLECLTLSVTTKSAPFSEVTVR
jgi:hypothetical protein